MFTANKQLESECKVMLTNHEQALLFMVEEIKKEVGIRRFEEESAFGYAKQVLRNQGVFEGLDLLMQRIHKYGGRE